jgi:hypothetical protein
VNFRRLRPYLFTIGLALAGIGIGYGVVADAWPVHNRSQYRGYFRNVYDDQGTYVMPRNYSGQAVPGYVNSADSFINFIFSNFSGTNQQRTGAYFIIQTMIGNSTNNPPTGAEVNDWQERVRAAQGSTSWNVSYCYNINSFYQATSSGPNPIDDAFYPESGCDPAIVFRNSAGAVVYAIRRECANPIGNGNVGTLEKRNNYNMTGHTVVSIAEPRPGQTFSFWHYVRNDGPDSAPAVWWATVNSLTGASPANGGPNSYTSGQERYVSGEDITVPLGTPPGTRYCRHVLYDPINGAGARNGAGEPECATVPYDFTLTPDIQLIINDTPSLSSFAEVGDKVQFRYTVRNAGTTISQLTNCTINGRTKNGYATVPTPVDTTSDPGFVAPATGCPRVFPLPPSNTELVTETIASVPASSANRTLCRTLSVTPSSPAGGVRRFESCVSIANKPYMRVYGGDVSAGNGFATTPGTCTANAQAAVVGWNKEGPTYAGAGVQFATHALNRIYDFATALGNSGGAPAGAGLAFANVSASGGMFGGTLGAMPCATNYYGNKPGTTTSDTSPINVGSLTNGAHTGLPATPGQAVRIGGDLNTTGQQTTMYVDGNVLIDSDIKYPANWSMTTRPYFQLIVRGNIYIARNVKQLDGMYVAQRNGVNGGNIYTCANTTLPATAIVPTGGTLYTNCSEQLIVNGAFVAYSVQFLRVKGTLNQSSAGERGDAASHAAEVFNFSPALWMSMPVGTGVVNDYDSITSLPPTL